MDDVSQFLGHPICDGPPTGDNGPEEGANFMYFGFGGTTLVAYTFLYLLSPSPPWLLMSLSVGASLFLSLLVESIVMGMYGLVSDSNRSVLSV